MKLDASEFDTWLRDLIRLAPEYVDTSYDDWAAYFEDWKTPQEAIEEDRSYD